MSETAFVNWVNTVPEPATQSRWRSFWRHLLDHIRPHAQNEYIPHMLADRALALMAFFLCVLKLAVLTVAVLGPIAPASSAAITVGNILRLTNETREASGVARLSNNPLLNQVAQSKAEDMLKNSYFAHTSPAGISPWYWFEQAGYKYKAAGENLAVNFTDDKAVLDAWLQSPGHKANMLNAGFTEIGIGVATGPFEGHVATFVVQSFGLPETAALPVQRSQGAARPSRQVRQPLNSPKTVREAATDVETTAAAAAEELDTAEPKVVQHRVSLENGQLVVEVRLEGGVTTAKASFAGSEVILQSMGEGWWWGMAKMDAGASGPVVVNAETQSGKVLNETVAQLEPDAVSAFGSPLLDANKALAAPTPAWELLQNSERVVYPVLIATIFTVILVSFLMHRHVRHLRMIANASFVVLLASILWVV